MTYVLVTVEAYAGYRGNERPQSFVMNGRRLAVLHVLDRWYEGGRTPGDSHLDYFKILADDGCKYMVRYHSLFDAWSAAPLTTGEFPTGSDMYRLNLRQT
jgi:hypothetical protein